MDCRRPRRDHRSDGCSAVTGDLIAERLGEREERRPRLSPRSVSDMGVRWRPPSLTLTLASLTVMLVLLSVGAVVAVVSFSDRQARDDIELRYGRTRAFAVTESLRRNLAQATPVLTEARLRVERGLLAVDNPSSLADFLVDKVRYQPDIAFFYYGDQATGRFVGAWRRDDGAVMLARSSADVDDGRRSEWEVGVDGH